MNTVYTYDYFRKFRTLIQAFLLDEVFLGFSHALRPELLGKIPEL